MSARRTCIAIAALGLAAGAAAAADSKAQLEIGRQEFKAKCAACHGDDGKGGGEQAATLKQKVPDLTTYAKRNGGRLPVKQAWALIDGRQLDDRAQQNRTMPVWGHTLQAQARAAEETSVEPYVRKRIEAILAYLRSIQAK